MIKIKKNHEMRDFFIQVFIRVAREVIAGDPVMIDIYNNHLDKSGMFGDLYERAFNMAYDGATDEEMTAALNTIMVVNNAQYAAEIYQDLGEAIEDDIEQGAPQLKKCLRHRKDVMKSVPAIISFSYPSPSTRSLSTCPSS